MYFDDKEKYIIIDIEGNAASGIDSNKITQFGALLFDGGSISEINYYNRNVNYINSYVARMTHISIKKCKAMGLSERHMVNLIYDNIKDCKRVYAYGCDYDIKALNRLFRKYELPELNINWYDVINDVRKYLCPSKSKLSIAANEYGFEGTSYHDALGDCYATFHLMQVIEKIKGK